MKALSFILCLFLLSVTLTGCPEKKRNPQNPRGNGESSNVHTTSNDSTIVDDPALRDTVASALKGIGDANEKLKNTATEYGKAAKMAQDVLSSLVEQNEKIGKEEEKFSKEQPSNCPRTLKKVIDDNRREFNNVSNLIDSLNNKSVEIIKKLIQIDSLVLRKYDDIGKVKPKNEAERKERLQKLDELRRDRENKVNQYKKDLEDCEIISKNISNKLTLKSSQITILSANIKFKVFETGYPKIFYFPTHKHEEKELREEDINEFKKEIKSVTDFLEKNMHKQEMSKLDISIVILAFGYTDMQPFTENGISYLPKDRRSGIMKLPSKEERSDQANQDLSELRAMTVSDYVLTCLREEFKQFSDKLEICSYGYGMNPPFINVKYQQDTKDDKERRIAKCFYHIIATEKKQE